MASTQANGLPPNFILTPQQQMLLFRALNSNQPANSSPQTNALSLSPSSAADTPYQNASNLNGANSVQESPFLDYDYDFGADNSFDFDLANDGSAMIGDLPDAVIGDDKSKTSSKVSSPDNENGDKRSHPDEDDDEREEGSSKRRESEGKVPKKPGRKPLTNEPSSKRKAQNRAAQRAFRERKEQHLKDLETKVKELEKASETANSENSQLRARMEKMTAELNEYKKKLSLINNSSSSRSFSGSSRPPLFGANLVNNLNDVNFQFEFPKFGVLPGPQSTIQLDSAAGTLDQSPSFSPQMNSFSAGSTPSDKSRDQATPGSAKSPANTESNAADALSKFSAVFNASPYEGILGNASRTSLDSTSFSISGANSGSPSSSSHSNAGPSSSCGTSPEPFTQSPVGFKPVDTLTTIGEEQSGLTNDTSDQNNSDAFNVNTFDWLAQQNGGQFDPQLFLDYREPQDNILANATFDDTFFSEAFDADFINPYNMGTSPKPPKKDLMAEIDARKEEEEPGMIQMQIKGQLLTCNKIWERLQTCPKVQAGDIDLDGLCSDLQKKAKCGGTGAVVDEKDFKAVMKKHLGPCPDSV